MVLQVPDFRGGIIREQLVSAWRIEERGNSNSIVTVRKVVVQRQLAKLIRNAKLLEIAIM